MHWFFAAMHKREIYSGYFSRVEYAKINKVSRDTTNAIVKGDSPDAVSPAELGLGTDERKLELGLFSMKMKAPQTEPAP